jgi:hypothetical protein
MVKIHSANSKHSIYYFEIKVEYHLIILFVILCWKRIGLCNSSEINSNNIVSALISYFYCQSKFVRYYTKLSKHIDKHIKVRCCSASDRISKINHGSVLYLWSN